MTPTAARLKERLDARRRWFQNEWFFKWHFIGNDGPIDIDSFDGSHFHYGGIAFSGTARDLYWQTVVGGVRQEIIDQFAWADHEVRNYNSETALRAIDECAGQLASFVRIIRREAVKKDRILRGDGVSFPSETDLGHWKGTSDGEIHAQAEAIKAALPIPTVNSGYTGESISRVASWWDRNQGWLGPSGWIIGAVGTASGLLTFLF